MIAHISFFDVPKNLKITQVAENHVERILQVGRI